MSFFSQLKGNFVFIMGALRALRMTTHIAKNPTRIFPNVLEELVRKYGDAPALLSTREKFTYRTCSSAPTGIRAGRCSRISQTGDTVCLLMPNRPEFMAIWLGVTRVGGVTALLNTNLVGPSLAHCVDIVEAKHVIVAAELVGLFEAVRPLLKSKPKVWLHGEANGEFAAHRPRDRKIVRRAAVRRGAAAAHHRGPRAVHLYVGHHRHAQGRQRQSLPDDAGVLWFRRRHEHQGDRPQLRLPADVPHRRRAVRDRLAAGQWRLRGHTRTILGARILGRHRAQRLHDDAIYRRVVPLSGQFAAASQRNPPPAADCLRQRPAA